jgi:hypothetical protein
MDMLAPYLAPSAIIGIGAWGTAVARGAEDALRDRSPTIARACPVLALAADEPAVPELVRAHLKASRLAEVIRALEREGLMRLDPVLAPATAVYLVCSLADDPDLRLLAQVADLLEQSAAELKARVVRAALVDLGVGRSLPAPVPGCPIYVLEPVTAKGLVLDPAEYQAAVVEALVAAVQPGAGAMLTGPGVKGVGTLGIAWLAWSPSAMRSTASRRLSREALLRCAEATTAVVAHARQSEAWACQAPDQRGQALLVGLPFRAGLDGGVVPAADLCGDSARRWRHSGGEAQRLRRCAAVLQRRQERWEERLEENAWRRAGQEGEALERSVQAALAAGPDGVARVKVLATELMKACARRQAHAPEPWPAPRIAPLLERLQQAEKLPPAGTAATALGVVWLAFSLIWWLAGGGWALWVSMGALLAAGGAGYGLWWRPGHVRQERQALREALNDRASALMQQAYTAALERLDQALEERCDAALRDIDRMVLALRSPARQEAGAGPGSGALSFPLVSEGDPLRHDWLPQVADVAAHLAREGCFRHWRDPDSLMKQATTLTEWFLADRVTLDPADLAARAHGDRLAERLQEGLQGLLGWAQPLLARPLVLPEGQRWLLWPEGLPCPRVEPEVHVLPFARSCAAVVTVVQGISEGIHPHSERSTG